MKPYFYPDLEKQELFSRGYIAKRSSHSRGSAVDLTLLDMNSGKELDMGGPFDFFGELSHPDYKGVTPEQFENRMLLRGAMLRRETRGDGSSARARSAPGGRSASAAQTRGMLPRMTHGGGREVGPGMPSRRGTRQGQCGWARRAACGPVNSCHDSRDEGREVSLNGAGVLSVEPDVKLFFVCHSSPLSFVVVCKTGPGSSAGSYLKDNFLAGWLLAKVFFFFYVKHQCGKPAMPLRFTGFHVTIMLSEA